MTSEAAAESVDLAIKYLKEGLSFCVYPEGTRSRDGHLLPFKRGTFVMAIRAGVPVVPVSLAGTQELMRKGDWRIYPGEVVVRFGQRSTPRNTKLISVRNFASSCRRWWPPGCQKIRSHRRRN